jgi:hypothetical protein
MSANVGECHCLLPLFAPGQCLDAQHIARNNLAISVDAHKCTPSSAKKSSVGRKPMAAVRRIIASTPRFLFILPGILAGIFIPTLIVSTPKPAPPNTVGMNNMDFTKDVVTLHRGQHLTFVDNSHNIHEIGPGQNGQITSPVRGDPLTGIRLMVTNSVYTTGPWLTLGKFYVTCGVHPMMNLTVVVVP